MDASFLTVTLSFLILLLISSFTFLFTRRFNLPYTVVLVVVGMLLVPLSNTEIFGFIDHFKLTPEVLFYVFLPVLLFEASYKIDYRKMIKDWRAIGILAVIGICISAGIIGGVLYLLFGLIGLHIPFLVTLLFGVIISATDPVAVLAIFASIGAPKRLALLFEGESLFNDGTAVALFLVVLGIIMSGHGVDMITFAEGFSSFFSMMLGGALFGGIIGFAFAKFIGTVKNAEPVEILLTMILAHITFLLAEFTTHFLHHTLHIEYLGVSGVVATVISGIVMGNYGKYKITPRVEHAVEQMWEFFAFVSNSVVFILMGLYLSNIEGINISDFIIPSIIAVIIVGIARAVSVYLPIGFLNKAKLGEKIPLGWQHIMSWGSLRGSLALMMVLMIPGKGDAGYDKILEFEKMVGWNLPYSIKDFILILVIACIMFTLLIKATTIPALMKKTKVSDLHEFEKLEFLEGGVLMLLKVIKKIKHMFEKGYISEDEYKDLIKKYNEKIEETTKKLKGFFKENSKDGINLMKRAVSVHSLGAEKKYLKELLLGNEIGEKNFRYILRKIDKQIDRLHSGKKQFRENGKNDYDIFQKMAIKSYKSKTLPSETFIRYRAKKIVSKKVALEIKELSKIDLGFDKNIFKDTIKFYEELHNSVNKKLEELIERYPKETLTLDTQLAEKSILRLEEGVINEMHAKSIISDKLYIKFKEEIEKEFYEDVTKKIETFTK